MPRYRWNRGADGTMTSGYTAKEYEAEYWSSTGYYDYPTGSYKDPLTPRQEGREYHIRQTVGPKQAEHLSEFVWRKLETQEIVDTIFTKDNSDIKTRYEQARVMALLGYNGPVSGGEARGLKNLFNALGLPDNVRRGHVIRENKVLATRYYGGFFASQRLQSCYVFKSPIPEIPFDKFIKLARLYKDDKGGIRRAVQAVMANPDAKHEVQASDAIEMLSKLTGL